MRTEELFNFIYERHQIYVKKAAGLPKPWTTDAILRQFRFCNVYRELDTVTQYIAENWRTPYQDLDEIWFYMVIARLVNWPETLAELPEPGKRWDPRTFIATLHRRKAAGQQVFNSAYIVSTNGRAQDKAEYLAQSVLQPMWDARKKFAPAASDTNSLEELYAELRMFCGMGSFMAAQVVADTKFVPRFATAYDFWTFAASGPGSRRGLNRVYEENPHKPWPEHEWLAHLKGLQLEIDPLVRKSNMPRISAQDLQNCLCEFDKYERVRKGQGFPRNRYNGG